MWQLSTWKFSCGAPGSFSVPTHPTFLGPRTCDKHGNWRSLRSNQYGTSGMRLECLASAQDDLPDASGMAMSRRFASEFQARQVQAGFDGRVLATLIHQKFGKSYDVMLVQRKVLGKAFVALNIMWRFLEQQSFTLNEEQYLRHLDNVAAVLNSWGVVGQVAAELQGLKSRPRVGKAVSIQLKVDPEKITEWEQA